MLTTPCCLVVGTVWLGLRLDFVSDHCYAHVFFFILLSVVKSLCFSLNMEFSTVRQRRLGIISVSKKVGVFLELS